MMTVMEGLSLVLQECMVGGSINHAKTMVKPLAVSSLERIPKALASVPLPRSPRKNSSACLPGGA
jgi:hypothetical protein